MHVHNLSSLPRGGTFLGSITILPANPQAKPLNLPVALLKSGLAKLQPTVDPSRLAGGQIYLFVQVMFLRWELSGQHCNHPLAGQPLSSRSKLSFSISIPPTVFVITGGQNRQLALAIFAVLWPSVIPCQQYLVYTVYLVLANPIYTGNLTGSFKQLCQITISICSGCVYML